ncbi:hypothetical protein RBSWK_00516 [Rhodopirellula baltica SWK14]|uniref:Uncharacterized protein n=1 Tax=Rhodopirellula baltica SWK14 TaxID=993516 RepID=L7CPP6_RHOBT|nr:hypothetical protein RBSWK_00516 [Rhodopirellula baltica SWK14]
MSSNRIENGLVNMAKSKMTSGSVKRGHWPRELNSPGELVGF